MEDNPADVELTLRALKKHNLTNHVQVVSDGAQALDYLFGTGSFAGQNNRPSAQGRFPGPEAAQGGRAARSCGA